MNARFSLLIVFALLVGGAVFLWLQPTEPGPTPPLPPPTTTSQARPGPISSAPEQFLILAASWQPAFCETARNKPECTSMGKNRFDASHFSLHGLWPRDEYCGVRSSIEQLDRDGRWQQLPPVELPADLQKSLAEVMPGTRSQLERHEWIKHGTCYGTDEASYYAASLALMRQLNASKVRDLFADNVGKRLTQAQIRSAFDDSFGSGAGQRVRIACEDDGSRRIISELTIGLFGTVSDNTRIATLMRAARPTSGGCEGGIVDPVRLQ